MFAHEKATTPVSNRPGMLAQRRRPEGDCVRESDGSVRYRGCGDDRDFPVKAILASHAGRRSRPVLHPCTTGRMHVRGRDRFRGFRARRMTDIEMSPFCSIAIMPVHIAGRERMRDVG